MEAAGVVPPLRNGRDGAARESELSAGSDALRIIDLCGRVWKIEWSGFRRRICLADSSRRLGASTRICRYLAVTPLLRALRLTPSPTHPPAPAARRIGGKLGRNNRRRPADPPPAACSEDSNTHNL